MVAFFYGDGVSNAPLSCFVYATGGFPLRGIFALLFILFPKPVRVGAQHHSGGVPDVSTYPDIRAPGGVVRAGDLQRDIRGRRFPQKQVTTPW